MDAHGKKKAFVDKKNATHYRLVPKSTAENAPNEEKRFVPTQEHLEEQHRCGIYFDDDYDYMQHLRDLNETATLQTLEKSAVQEKFVILAPKQSAIQSPLLAEPKFVSTNDDEKIFDEDIEKALEGDFEDEIEGGLEDDFIALAGGVVEPISKSLLQHRQPVVHYASDGDDEDSDFDDNCGNSINDSEEENAENKLCNLRCNAPRREIDERFDQLLEADYHNDQLGELDGDDYLITGALEPTDERVKRMIKESNAGPIDDDESSKEWTRQRIRLAEANGIEEDIMENVEVDESSSKRLKWDCESYATQYTNLYNRPTLIQNPKSHKMSRSHKSHREVLDVDEMEVCDEKTLDVDEMSKSTTVSTYRPKNETPEQRRLRKQAVKEARRFRRQEKKGNRLAFAEERRKLAKGTAGQIKTISIV
ncbi:Low temperature viability protein [Dictyocaulus viviparus]|uniref:Protein LTV1 homolog n=1 Tax=Dictyocaulus viviparus TaxID=29172 RepID=A0A0D8XEH5_DICVI|nr:Low temperature viability protein [Dictyocaulus viviparus]